jgi:hypothetical protein
MTLFYHKPLSWKRLRPQRKKQQSPKTEKARKPAPSAAGMSKRRGGGGVTFQKAIIFSNGVYV